MYCTGTDIAELATIVKQTVDGVAAQHPDLDIYGVHLFLQGESAQAGGGHTHYGIYCTSYGGDPAAVEALAPALPTQLYCLRYDETAYEDAGEAFHAAYNELGD